MKENNRPIKRYKAGAISVSVFRNGKTINGKAVDFLSFQMQRAYKDRNGDWKNTSSLRVNDLPKAELLMKKAYEDVVMKDGNSTSDEGVV